MDNQKQACEKPTEKEVIWAWCPICWTQTYQVFEEEEGVYEKYRCDTCGQLHEIAVR